MTIEEQEQFVVNRLREERERHHMTQLELALESGVSQNMIVYIEGMKRTPTLSTLLKLCAALKISPSILFPQDQAPSSETELIQDISAAISKYSIEKKVFY